MLGTICLSRMLQTLHWSFTLELWFGTIAAKNLGSDSEGGHVERLDDHQTRPVASLPAEVWVQCEEPNLEQH